MRAKNPPTPTHETALPTPRRTLASHRPRLLALAAIVTGLLCLGSAGTMADDGIPVATRDSSGPLSAEVSRLPPVESAFRNVPANYLANDGEQPPAGEESFLVDPPTEGDSEGEVEGELDVDSDEWVSTELQPLEDWLDETRVGYDRGFVVASDGPRDLRTSDMPFLLRVNGLLQLRQTHLDSTGPNRDLNQFQLIRGRLAFSGNAFSPELGYFVQLDGRSSAGDEFRLLDYNLDFDFGRRFWGLERRALVFKAGKYKVPFTMARYISAREFQFSDRSMASMYFDVNRSLAWGLSGRSQPANIPTEWEMALFNGIVTGGAETGSSGRLDNNFAYSARFFLYPSGDWGTGTLADFDWHETLATRFGGAFVGSTIDRNGPTEFESIRVVDSGERLSDMLPASVRRYDVHMYCVDASCKYRGWSVTSEYYFRMLSGFQGDSVPSLFDHGYWLQVGKFVVPGKVELISRWSRIVGDSGTLGQRDQSADEYAAGFVWYFNGQNARLTFDATHLDGAPINASSLDIFAGDQGWLFRTQIQLAF